ncbi:MAG TPA: glycerophosphodiester phosphodiesterase [Devosia sp.]|nr:glycerophosphodiester phosphodiesterase [Devosia sp.]
MTGMTDMMQVLKYPIAHRGLHDRKKGVIENSTTAFARAIKAGYGIETDLQLSGDGVPMVFHDSDLARLTRQKGKVNSLSAGQLSRIRLTASRKKDTPQTFAELLQQVNGQVPLVVELKRQEDGRNAQLARTAVQAARDYEGPLVFKSFYPDLLREVKNAGFAGPVGIVLTRITPSNDHYHELSALQRFAVHNLLHYPGSRFDFISSDHMALDLPAVRLLHHFGMPVMTWTVNDFATEQKTRGHADQIVFEQYLPYRATR